MNSYAATRGSQEAGFTQPGAHPMADPCINLFTITSIDARSYLPPNSPRSHFVTVTTSATWSPGQPRTALTITVTKRKRREDEDGVEVDDVLVGVEDFDRLRGIFENPVAMAMSSE